MWPSDMLHMQQTHDCAQAKQRVVLFAGAAVYGSGCLQPTQSTELGPCVVQSSLHVASRSRSTGAAQSPSLRDCLMQLSLHVVTRIKWWPSFCHLILLQGQY